MDRSCGREGALERYCNAPVIHVWVRGAIDAGRGPPNLLTCNESSAIILGVWGSSAGGARLLGMEKVAGSIPACSTTTKTYTCSRRDLRGYVYRRTGGARPSAGSMGVRPEECVVGYA